MNKKREALRRGLRSFIQDTSRELADLEGRDLHPSPPPEKSDNRKGSGDAASRPVAAGEAVSRRRPPAQAAPPRTVTAAPGAPATAAPGPPAAAEPPPGTALEPAEIPARPTPPPVAAESQGEATGTVAPEPLANGMAERAPVGDVAPPLRNDGVAPDVPPLEIEHTTSTGARSDPPAIHDGKVPGREQRRARSPRRAAAPAQKRPRSRTVAEIGSNGVSAEQVRARKGVCFAYFINHECWRVPDAYCLTALHVCITRECPVFHLHRETLERRFARKFKHFW